MRRAHHRQPGVQFNFANLNPNCEEPINFAFLQRNGVPAGPPSPQLTDLSTFTPNHETLMMNQGDSVATHIQDTRTACWPACPT